MELMPRQSRVSGERRTERGKDAGRPNSSAIWPTEDAAPRSVRRRQACAGVSPGPPQPASEGKASGAADQLLVDKLVGPVAAQLTTEAGALEAAERQLRGV